MNKYFFFRKSLCLIVICLLLGVNVFAQQDLTGKPTGNFIKPTTVKSIGRLEGIDGIFVSYNDSLLRGGEIENNLAINKLKERGVSVIISNSENAEAKGSAKKQGIKYYYIPFDKTVGLNAKAYKSFLKATVKQDGMYFFTSKDEGKHEAGIFCAIYRMVYEKWTYEEAMREYIKLGGAPLDDKICMESVRDIVK